MTTPIRRSYPIRRIVTHFRPHLDEIVAILLLRIFGKIMFPGIETAEVVFCDAGKTIDGRPAEWHLEHNSTLHVGTGGGILDEHPTLDGKRRKKGQSATSLVAKLLTITDPRYRKLVDLVTKADRKGVDPLHLGNLIKYSYDARPDKVRETWDWAVAGIKAFIDQKKEVSHAELSALLREQSSTYAGNKAFDKLVFTISQSEKTNHPLHLANLMKSLFANDQKPITWALQAAQALLAQKEEFNKARGIIAALINTKPADQYTEINTEKGKIKVLLVNSPNYALNRAAFKEFNVGILIIRRENGHTAILTNQRHGESVNFEAIIGMIRIQDFKKRTGSIKELPVDRLCAEGSDPLVPHWFAQQEARAMFNGTHTAPNQTPTCLSGRDIFKIVTTCAVYPKRV